MKTLSITINGQKAYGKEYSVTDTFAYYELKLQSKFSAEQVLYALDKYTDIHNDIPAPSDIINILSPEEPKVTQIEYLDAIKKHELNGFKAFSPESMVIEQYKKENYEATESYEIECDKIKEICSNSVKRIEG